MRCAVYIDIDFDAKVINCLCWFGLVDFVEKMTFLCTCKNGSNKTKDDGWCNL